MPYYPTIEEDLARAKAILERGKAEPLDPPLAWRTPIEGGTIYVGDTYDAYKLLESFVVEIERLRSMVASMARVLDRETK